MQLWKLAALAAVCVPLAACAGTYNEAAVPAAKASLELGKEQCTATRKISPAQTNAEYTECLIAADRAFAVAIKLKDMRLYDAYAARMRLAASQRDAGAITREEMQAKANQIFADYVASIDQSARVDAEQRARVAAALSAMGQSMQREADRQAYIQAHQPQPFNCTSTGFGNTVTTRCN